MYELLSALGPQILADLARNAQRGALFSPDDLTGKQRSLPIAAGPSAGEDMDALLRSIRHYITPKELAYLLHMHRETIYRKIKSGMPAHRDVDAQGHGRRLKIYPPEIADCLLSCREAELRRNQLRSVTSRQNDKDAKGDAQRERARRGGSKAGKVVKPK